MAQSILVQNYRPSGTQSKLNIVAAAVGTSAAIVKSSSGVLSKIVATGAVTTLTINDAATVAAAATANVVYATTAALAAGTVISLDFPCKNGIVVSAFTGGGSIAVSFG